MTQVIILLFFNDNVLNYNFIAHAIQKLNRFFCVCHSFHLFIHEIIHCCISVSLSSIQFSTDVIHRSVHLIICTTVRSFDPSYLHQSVSCRFVFLFLRSILSLFSQSVIYILICIVCLQELETFSDLDALRDQSEEKKTVSFPYLQL